MSALFFVDFQEMLKAFHQNQHMPNFSENYQKKNRFFFLSTKENLSNQIERIIKLNHNKLQDDKNFRFINPFFFVLQEQR